MTKSADRRHFLKHTLALGAVAVVARGSAAPPEAERLLIACNEYPWRTFYQREAKNFRGELDQSLAAVASTNVDSFEPLVDSPASLDQLVPLLKKHGLAMRSLYVNSVLHDPEAIPTSTDQVLAIATKAQELAGTTIIVTNPAPIRWGGSEDKSDEQLRIQANALDQLGAKLRELGLTLAYHNHDAEFRQGGREFHHMLTATDPANVKFCLDAHWVFRGCGDSEVALFDALMHYHERVVELHLRQSSGGIWTEAFTLGGDIDYARLFAFLAEHDLVPHLVLEQAVEAQSSRDLTAVEAHRLSRDNLAEALR